MKASYIIKLLIQERVMNQTELANRLHVKHQSSISQYLSRDLKISKMVEISNVLGCEVVVRDKLTKKEWRVDQ